MDGRVQHDGFGRDINYLRIAVTDKCNFRCIYCMPADGVAPRAHDELLSAEEIARFVRLVAGEGIRRVRLTGGEPLVSRRIIPLTIPPVTARYFRFEWTPVGSEPGSEDLDAAKWKPNLKINDIVLHTAPRIHQWEGKTGLVRCV